MKTEDRDPILTAYIDGNKQTFFNMRAIAAMQTGWTNQLNALIGGQWVMITTPEPDAVFARWQQVLRAEGQ